MLGAGPAGQFVHDDHLGRPAPPLPFGTRRRVGPGHGIARRYDPQQRVHVRRGEGVAVHERGHAVGQVDVCGAAGWM